LRYSGTVKDCAIFVLASSIQQQPARGRFVTDEPQPAP
jgi:hypothetical protein